MKKKKELRKELISSIKHDSYEIMKNAIMMESNEPINVENKYQYLNEVLISTLISGIVFSNYIDYLGKSELKRLYYLNKENEDTTIFDIIANDFGDNELRGILKPLKTYRKAHKLLIKSIMNDILTSSESDNETQGLGGEKIGTDEI